MRKGNSWKGIVEVGTASLDILVTMRNTEEGVNATSLLSKTGRGGSSREGDGLKRKTGLECIESEFFGVVT